MQQDHKDAVAVFWFRRDLRWQDNTALYHALCQHDKVLPIFIFDKHILEGLQDKTDPRITFIYDAVIRLKLLAEKKGATVLVFHATPEEAFSQLLAEYKITHVYTNTDYEPYATERDKRISEMLHQKGVEFQRFKDQVIFEKSEVVKDDGSPYVVFTPYAKKWMKNFYHAMVKPWPSEQYLGKLCQLSPAPAPELKSLGFKRSKLEIPSNDIDTSIVKNYHKNRDYPARTGTTRLSVHLRFGTISIRKATARALELNETWLNELIWRNFYMTILWHFPHVVTKSFRPAYDQILWRNDEEEFKAWCEGRTGYPIVDAGMRELNHTGFMHNRVRMITASFLVKHLLIDWRWGEAYFARKLLDYELASNNGGWQWAAGSGTDAAPYFRIFNPYEQTKKFDPKLNYIRKWVPEFQELTYPKPLVEHKFARQRALDTFKKALKG